VNTVFILTDQHNPFFSGCYGHRLAQTPAMDSIAARGVRFQCAYTNSPLCAPARAALFTGRYVFENSCWDNAFPWDGAMRGWPDHFAANRVHLATIGKLEFTPGGDCGIAHEMLVIHRNSRDIHGLFRHEPELPPRWSEHTSMQHSGPRAGLREDSFDDRTVALRAAKWIANERPDVPWVLNVNFLQPHPPWPCPPELWEKWYSRVELAQLEEKYFESFDKLHPNHQAFAHHSCGRYADDELLRRCYAAYLAHIEMADNNVRIVLDALTAAGILDQTLVLCASDHGENCRAHRMWGKMNMYEDAIRVPLLAMGPGVQRGAVESSPVSLLDIFPSISDAAGLAPPRDFRGISLLEQLRGTPGAKRNRFVLSEYHANGAPSGLFAVSDGRIKYVRAAGQRPMLFDLEHDPQEMHDLAVECPADRLTLELIAERDAWLCALCSPQGVDARAKRDQAALRREMQADGTLEIEIYKRGYERRSDKLVPRPEFVPKS
jgi:choline-sulfatase